ncbi:hypothetical protein KEM60_03138 [Austwickia sp. TVS 96-490-7B]|nr:hypothetical protein [Austwickia sp. TVS 96-490-7B]
MVEHPQNKVKETNNFVGSMASFLYIFHLVAARFTSRDSFISLVFLVIGVAIVAARIVKIKCDLSTFTLTFSMAVLFGLLLSVRAFL